MKNGRCRMHGGATPSHTATARARIAAARTKTGERTQEMRAHCENVAAFIRRNRIVVAMARLLILPIWETSLDLEQFAAYFSAQTPMRPENTESQARSSRHLSQQITDGGSRIESGAGDDVGVGNVAEARRAPRAFPHKPPLHPKTANRWAPYRHISRSENKSVPRPLPAFGLFHRERSGGSGAPYSAPSANVPTKSSKSFASRKFR